MDHFSRAGLTFLFVFVLTLWACSASAVTMPQGPDNINLRASEGINIGTRAGQWEFQNALAGAEARAAASINVPKGPAIGILLKRALSKQALVAVAANGVKLIGPAGLALSFAPLVYDALTGEMKVPGVADPDKNEYDLPGLSAPGMTAVERQVAACDQGVPLSIAPASSTTYNITGLVQLQGMVYWVSCPYGSPHEGARVYSGSFRPDSNVCWSSPNAVLLGDTMTCAYVGSGVVASDAQIVDAYSANYDADPDAGRKIAEWGNANSLPMESGAPETSGPSHVVGQTETTTSTTDAGTTTVERQHAYDLDYAGIDVAVAESVTETTTDETGNTTTKTIASSVTGEGPAAPPSEEVPDPCALHPDASGCAPLGDVPDGPDLPVQDVPVTFGYTSVTASCPAPESFSVFGSSYSFEWTPVCTYATAFRPVIVALSLLGGLLLVVKVSRG